MKIETNTAQAALNAAASHINGTTDLSQEIRNEISARLGEEIPSNAVVVLRGICFELYEVLEAVELTAIDYLADEIIRQEVSRV